VNLLQVQRELIDCERKVTLMNMIVTETKELQDLTIYPSNYQAGDIVFTLSSHMLHNLKSGNNFTNIKVES